MKPHHVAALVCFAISCLVYALASSQVISAAFGFLGFVIEFAGYGALSSDPKKEAKTSVETVKSQAPKKT